MTATAPPLAERLGFAPDAKLLIVNCDDLGSSRSANVAIYEALRDGVATSATLMVPCPWARDAAAMYRGEDVGVHLTLNAEWDTYRWGPITHSPSLLDGDGGFPRTVQDVWDHADSDEVRKECRAQIERAIYWGFDISHLDSHMGTLQLRPEFFDVYLEMAVDFGLPLRMAGGSAERLIGFPYRRLAAEENVVFPDHFVYTSVGSRRTVERALFDLQPGVTEIYFHPAIDTDELRASHPDWANRVEDHACLTRDPAFRDLIERSGAVVIGYRELRDLQRAARVTPDALAALCDAAMPHERLTASELDYLCFGAGDEVIGDDDGAATLQIQRFGEHVVGWLTLLAVHPRAQERGRGKELVSAVVERARANGAENLLLASVIPRYVWLGVDLFNTRAGMLLESCGFERDWVSTNMVIATTFRRAAPPGITVERETGAGAHDFAARAFPRWVPELDRAVALGTAFAARDAEGATVGFGCHSVNRFGWIGPMATDPELQHGGVGSAVIVSLCADLEARGCATGEISGAANLRFYGKCGAQVCRVLMGGKLDLRVQPA